MAVIVRKNLVPKHSRRVIAPKEKLLARDLETVGHMDCTCILSEVVSTNKTHFTTPGEDGTGSLVEVLPPGQIDFRLV